MRDEQISDIFVSRVLNGEGGVLGSYVIAAEIVYEDHTELKVTVSEGLAPWTAVGMLSTAGEIASAALPIYGGSFGDFPEFPEEDMDDNGSG